MNPGFRYHIASLASVFFALGIGVVMGTLVVGGKVVDRQARLVQQLERRMEDLQVDMKRRGQSDTALLRVVSNAAVNLWKGKSVSFVSVEKANAKKLIQTVSELGPAFDSRYVSLKDGKWVDDDNEVTPPTISLKLDGTDDIEKRVIVFILPPVNVLTELSTDLKEGLITLMANLMELDCDVIVVAADDGNASFVHQCVNVGIPVVTNAETSVGLAAVMLSVGAKPAVYGTGQNVDDELPSVTWSAVVP